MTRLHRHTAARASHRRHGMTLIEVLVASVLLGVGVAGLMFAASLGLRNQARLGQRIAGTYVAAGKLAEIDVIGPRMWSLTQPDSGIEEQGQQQYEWSTQIEALTEGELYDVQVTVSWNDGSGSGSVELETLLNDYDAVSSMSYDEQNRNSPIEAGR